MDRQDIDALLIGALYGELTPADEARLATHLESHPADRGALDDLKVARQKVHESRIFAVQVEPPQAISALLLQEAHRRAPKAAVEARDEREGWFARFARNFMAHPAMAAAAMLVLVLGGAGIVFMRQGDKQFANKEVAMQSSSRAAVPASTDQPIAAPAAAPQGAADTNSDNDKADGMAYGTAAGSAYEAQLYEGEAAKREQAKQPEVAKEKQKTIAVGSVDRTPKDFGKADIARSRDDGDVERRATAPAKKAATKGSLSADDESFGTGNAIGGYGRAGTANAVSGADYAQPPPPPPPAVQAAPGGGAPAPKTAAPKAAKSAESAPAMEPTSTTTAAPAPVTAPATPPRAEAPAQTGTTATSDAKAEAKPAPTKEQSVMSWAKEQHAAAIRLANAGKCTDAAKIAVAVSKQAPAYYTQNMATDRSLKSCAQYINAERERDADRAKKAAPAKATDTK